MAKLKWAEKEVHDFLEETGSWPMFGAVRTATYKARWNQAPPTVAQLRVFYHSVKEIRIVLISTIRNPVSDKAHAGVCLILQAEKQDAVVVAPKPGSALRRGPSPVRKTASAYGEWRKHRPA